MTLHGAERTAGPIDRAFHEGELQRLEAALRAAATDSALPEAARARAGLEDLLLRLRESPPFSG